MKANLLVKRNVAALLRARGQHQKDLAQWCHNSESWISKILDEDSPRVLPLKYWDRVADFFGLDTFHLLRPGLDHLLERRTRVKRRQTVDRRADAPTAALEELIGYLTDEQRTVVTESVRRMLRERIPAPRTGEGADPPVSYRARDAAAPSPRRKQS